MSNKEIKKYDDRGNLIYWRWSSGYESWKKYDENNSYIYFKNSKGSEYWYKYDKFGNQTMITEKEYNEIEFKEQEKEYNSRTKCSRFELMDI